MGERTSVHHRTIMTPNQKARVAYDNYEAGTKFASNLAQSIIDRFPHGFGGDQCDAIARELKQAEADAASVIPKRFRDSFEAGMFIGVAWLGRVQVQRSRHCPLQLRLHAAASHPASNCAIWPATVLVSNPAALYSSLYFFLRAIKSAKAAAASSAAFLAIGPNALASANSRTAR